MTSVKSSKQIVFTEGKLFPQILLFVLPIVATNLLQTFYNAADMMVVSLSDEVNAVGAIGMTGSYVSLIVNIFIGFSVGANVVVAKHIGAKDDARVQRAVHTSLILALLFGVLGGGIGIALARPILKSMGATGNLLELAVTYTYIYFSGIPFLALTNYLSAIFRAKGDSKTPLIVLAIAGLLNVAGNFFFVLVLRLSVEGVALATALANVFAFIVLLIRLIKSKDATAFSFRKLKIDGKEMKRIVLVGFPAAIQGALFSVSNILIQSSIVTVNNNVCPPGLTYQPVVNGSAAAANLEAFTYTAMDAVYQGAVTFTSQNMGGKKPERVKPIQYCCYALAGGIGLVLGLVILLLKTPLLSLYGIVPGEAGSVEAIAMGAATTRIWFFGTTYFICGLMNVGTGVLRGLGKSGLSTLIALIGSCLLRVVWLWTVFPLYPTFETILLCYPITWILTLLTFHIVIHVLLKGILKKKKLERDRDKKQEL
ncbi:MAG: MATE family efflux transporter [Clostridia bacterium]|nr:MATE family efflux transporter [Clostridia bacterium]